MINSALRRKIEDSIDAVKTELIARGFSDDVIQRFVERSNFAECLRVLEFIAKDSEVTAWNTRYRFSLIVATCAWHDKKRILYGLEKRNVRTEEELETLREAFRIHFEDRCPKIVRSHTKRRATQELLANLEETTGEQN